MRSEVWRFEGVDLGTAGRITVDEAAFKSAGVPYLGYDIVGIPCDWATKAFVYVHPRGGSTASTAVVTAKRSYGPANKPIALATATTLTLGGTAVSDVDCADFPYLVLDRTTSESGIEVDITVYLNDDESNSDLTISQVDLGYLQFDTSPSLPADAEGLLHWDSSNHCPAFVPDDTTAKNQVGQENWVRVYNDSGAEIANGSAVYASGTDSSEGGRLEISLAKADSASTAKLIGLATTTISNGSYGYVTQFGNVNDIDTSAFSAGDPIWLSADTAGEYVSTEPESPNFSVFIGFVAASDASAGRVFVTALGNTGSRAAGEASELTVPARKGSAGTITKGQAVYLSGYNAGQDVLEVELADSDGSGTMPALGLANDTITNSANGDVLIAGRITALNTSSFSAGDAIYVDTTAGALTNTRPTDVAVEVQKIGICARSNASNGVILVQGAGRTNDESNDYQIGSSFPSNPNDGTLFFHTTHGEWFFYDDGRSAWLSVKELVWDFGRGGTSTATIDLRLGGNVTSGSAVGHPNLNHDYVVTGYEAHSSATFTGTLQLKQNGSNLTTVSFSSESNKSDDTLNVSATASGGATINCNILYTSGTIGNPTVRWFLRRVET